MSHENIEPGTAVRYPRTGSSGLVTRLVTKDGRQFAELDSTKLLYRLDQLIPAELSIKTKKEIGRDEQLAGLERERRQLEEESLEENPALDSTCSGAG